MPWFEQAIYVTPATSAIEELRTLPSIRDHLYHIRDLGAHRWFDRSAVHSIPHGELAVVRTIGDPTDDLAHNDVSWHDVPDIKTQYLQILPSVPKVATVMEEELSPAPPEQFLRFLKHLSTNHTATLVLYSGASWGGPIEYEYAWIFEPSGNEFAYCLNAPENGYRQYLPNDKMESRDGDIQHTAMMHLGIELPSKYCAFFDSSFPWQRFKVTPVAT